MDEDEYLSGLFSRWCECSPYGDQIPDEWPEMMAAFVKEHAGKDRDQMADLFMGGDPECSFERLLESVFKVSCAFVLRDLREAVYDGDAEKLKVIRISASSVLKLTGQ
jgi:hypothetical protein